MWVHVRVSLLLPISLMSRSVSSQSASPQTSAALQFPSPIVLLHQHIHPGGGGGDTFTPFYPSLKFSKLCQCSCDHVFQLRGVAQMKEHLDSIVDYVHYVCTK